MNISFDLYNIFYYVCEFKNITKAANFLYVSQPAITKQIKNLENALGKQLIIKVPKGIELTEDGMILYNEIKEHIEKLQQVEQIFNEKNNNYDITIRIIAGYNTIKKILLPSLSKFNKKHSNVKFELSTYPFIESIQKLKEGKADLIFLSMKEATEEYKNIKVVKFASFQDIFVVRSDQYHDYPKKINMFDLNNYPIICKAGSSVSRRNIEDILRKQGIEFTPTYQLSNNWLVEEYVKLGLGMGLATKEFLTKELTSGEVKEIKTDIKIPKREVGYAYRNNSLIYPILKEFINDLNDNIKNKSE